MNTRWLGKVVWVAVATVSWSTSGHALVVQMDQFMIVKNSVPVFTDDFSASTTPSQQAGYDVNGAFPNGAEAGGLLTMDSSWGLLSTNASGQARQSLIVTRLTNNDPALSPAGLTKSDTIDVHGIFNLVTPSGPQINGYGIRVRDSLAGQPSPTRIAELDVQYNAAFGGDVIRYLLQDFVTHTTTNLGFVPLSPPAGADQVELVISRPDVTNSDFYGEYAFGTGGTFGPLTQFSTPVSLFSGTDFVRGQFLDFTAVPEPASLALLGIGFACLAANRRRRSR